MFYIYWFVGLLLALSATVLAAAHYELTHEDPFGEKLKKAPKQKDDDASEQGL